MFDMADGKPTTAPRPGSWASTNYIQRSGLVGSMVLYGASLALSFSNLRAGVFLGVVAWSSLLLGYVAGSLWRVRHAIHFWWSLAFAAFVHASLLPVYTKFARLGFEPHAGKTYMYLSVYLVIGETLLLIVLLKRIAMWIHRRQNSTAFAAQV